MRVISLKNYCESTRVVIQLLQYQNKVTMMVIGRIMKMPVIVMMMIIRTIIIINDQDHHPLHHKQSYQLNIQ